MSSSGLQQQMIKLSEHLAKEKRELNRIISLSYALESDIEDYCSSRFLLELRGRLVKLKHRYADNLELLKELR